MPTHNVITFSPGRRVFPEPGCEVYSVKEVAAPLSLSLGITYGLVRDGTIPAMRMGGRWLIPRRAFHAWLDSVGEVNDPGLR